ncbi:MAG: CusA/CzcA family heavy metal efflux RND transporter [Myxococcales bacterium]|nr:CusA/CzcA family heavy metal efflux RND transporter [Myxococcales bacterium]
MIDAILQWSLSNRLLVVVAAVGLLIWGTVEALRMPIDVFPDLTAPTVTVLADAHGMAPEEMERLVTFPIETALNGAAGVRRVRSSTAIGISVIWVEFEWGTDIFRARQIVSEKLQLARSTLPPEMEPPVLAPVSSIMGEIMFLAVTSEAHTPMDVRTQVDWEIRRRLLAVPGVSQVIPIGGDKRQFQVILNPERLAAYGVSSQDVFDALRHSNEDTSAGFYLEGGQEHLIHGLGRLTRVSDIQQTVVALRGEQPVTVGDVADVQMGAAQKRGEGSYNGAPGVIVGIQKQPGVNTLALTERLDDVLDELSQSLPEGMVIHRHIFRQADFIRVSVDNVADALLDGAILVVVIVMLFLLSGRATIITATAIPLSLLAAALVLQWLGGTINTMTLGGMAIAVGALVDDAIIDVENVARRLREDTRRPPEERRPLHVVVFEASKEIRTSIVFATLIIILVFLPLFFLHGVEGRLLEPLGLAYVVSLAASLLVALTVTPVLCLWWLPSSRMVSKGEEPTLIRWMRAWYGAALRFVLPRWVWLAAPSLVAMLLSLAALSWAGRAFLPDFNEGTLTVSAVTLPGTSLQQSDALGEVVERVMLRHPEVVSTARRTGRAELDEHAQGANAAEIDVTLDMKERSKAEFLSALRRDFAALPGMNLIIGQPISHRIDHMLSGTRANIAVKLFGPDLYELRRIAQRIQGAMQGVEGVVDLSIEQQADIPFVTIRLRRAAIAGYGLRVEEVAEAMETAFAGQVVTRLLEGQAAFDLVVRYDPDLVKRDLDKLKRLLLQTPTGAWVPLEAVADIRRDLGPNRISRENASRLIVIMCNVAERDLQGVVGDIQRKLAADVPLPAGYHVEYGGQFEAAEQASQTLLWLGLVALLGIFMLLQVAFSSTRDALLVMLNLPLALIGGVVGVYLSGGVLSIASMIGFITLFGIATRNGIMMVSHIRHLVQVEGEQDLTRAVLQGAEERLAPILMTALASGLGLLPLAMAAGEPGAEIQAPMAVVILCGLVSSTLLNMFVVPALYRRFGALRQALDDVG